MLLLDKYVFVISRYTGDAEVTTSGVLRCQATQDIDLGGSLYGG